MNYVIKILKKELKRLESVKSPNYEMGNTRKLRIAELELAISVLKGESDQFNEYLES